MLRIGAVAERTGVSERTLRYYEEIGLIVLAAHPGGGTRRYQEQDVARVERIRELQSVMGFNLCEIREIMAAEDRLEALRGQYHSESEPAKRELLPQLLDEAIGVLTAILVQVDAKSEKLALFRSDLAHRIERFEQLRAG